MLLVLSLVLLMLRDVIQARAVIGEALHVCLRHHGAGITAPVLDASAELAFLEGFPDRAMRLKGAADRIYDRTGTKPSWLAVASSERWISRAERSLGKSAQTARREGRQLTFAEAAAYALAAPDSPPPRAAVNGEPNLSGREWEIAKLVATGMTNDAIAVRLGLSLRTVDAHMEHIRTKLGVRSRVEVANWLGTNGALP